MGKEAAAKFSSLLLDFFAISMVSHSKLFSRSIFLPVLSYFLNPLVILI